MIARRINLNSAAQPFLRYAIRTVNTNITKTTESASIGPTGNHHLDKTLDNVKAKIFEAMSIYEEAIGLKEIKEAQQSVLEVCKKLFIFQKFNWC